MGPSPIPARIFRDIAFILLVYSVYFPGKSFYCHRLETCFILHTYLQGQKFGVKTGGGGLVFYGHRIYTYQSRSFRS